MESNLLIKRFKSILLFIFIYTILFILFFKTLKYTLPFVLALIFAFLLKRPSKYLIRKFSIRPWLSSLITTITLFSSLLLVLFLITIVFVSETINLTKHIEGIFMENKENIFMYIKSLQNSTYSLSANFDESIVEKLNTTIHYFINSGINSTVYMFQQIFNMIKFVPYWIMTIFFTLISTYLLTKEISMNSYNKFLKSSTLYKYPKILSMIKHSKKMILNYFLSTITLILISTSLTFIGFSFLGINYSLVLSLLSGILDLLPIVGTILVYAPLIIIKILNEEYLIAVLLFILYILIMVARQLLEPKLISSTLGITPLSSLMAIFIGLQAYGFLGVIFFIFMIVFYNMLNKFDVL
ncbi:MAG: sporulation integral membrane protein YtvI [Clostridium perfringens]|nr:sporulation integral membrane protein YtvI [Clostridium perfringens]